MSADGIDIFCRVIDNYGDIGVCWRLARQLAAQPDQPLVRLWVDDLASFARIEPHLQPSLAHPFTHSVQVLHGVHIHSWSQAETHTITPYPVVIEAFGCDLPEPFKHAMQGRSHIWINLEYLSAETWVENCHGLPSPQSNGVSKLFFFPGFTMRTGGLLREPGLLAQRDAWLAQPSQRVQLLQRLGVPADWINGLLEQNWQQVYAFNYAHAPLSALVESYQTCLHPTVLLAAPGTPATPPHLSDKVKRFDCPFVSQTDFDALLWSSDLNIVRGEDSFVRAIWAARPFIWHIYPQHDNAHLHKLDAWLNLAPSPVAAPMIRAWNQGDADTVRQHLSQLLSPTHWPSWQAQARLFSQQQSALPDLVQRLRQATRPQTHA